MRLGDRTPAMGLSSPLVEKSTLSSVGIRHVDGVMMGTLNFGERTKLRHGQTSGIRFRNNEPAGVKGGYVSGIMRSAVLRRHWLAIETLEAQID